MGIQRNISTSINKNNFICFVAILSFLNIYGTQSYLVSLLITIIEYAIVYFLIFKGKLFQTFVAYILFLSTALEKNDFIYYDGVMSFHRFNFFEPGLVFKLTSILIFLLLYKQCHGFPFINRDVKRLKKWLNIITVTGLISMLLTIVFNDHNVVTSGYPLESYFNIVLSYFALLSVFYSAIIICGNYKWREELCEYSIYILMGVALSTIASILLGYNGWYGIEYKTMLAPLLAGFIPCLLLFVKNRSFSERLFFVAVVIVVVFLAFRYPTPIGSKWYLVIAVSIVYLLYSFFPHNNKYLFIGLAVALLMIVPVVSQLLSSIMASDDYNNWKFNQAMGLLDIFSAPSIEYWFFGLEESARFRFDEPINIAIEYINEPLYALFGKGFGGMTLHYTPFCDWNVASAFGDAEQKLGAYSNMHETFASIFLRHGVLGIVFFVDVLIMLFRKIQYSPFTVWGVVWFFFYWSYGGSFRLGAVACVIALCTDFPQKTFVNRKCQYND